MKKLIAALLISGTTLVGVAPLAHAAHTDPYRYDSQAVAPYTWGEVSVTCPAGTTLQARPVVNGLSDVSVTTTGNTETVSGYNGTKKPVLLGVSAYCAPPGTR